MSTRRTFRRIDDPSDDSNTSPSGTRTFTRIGDAPAVPEERYTDQGEPTAGGLITGTLATGRAGVDAIRASGIVNAPKLAKQAVKRGLQSAATAIGSAVAGPVGAIIGSSVTQPLVEQSAGAAARVAQIPKGMSPILPQGSDKTAKQISDALERAARRAGNLPKVPILERGVRAAEWAAKRYGLLSLLTTMLEQRGDAGGSGNTPEAKAARQKEFEEEYRRIKEEEERKAIAARLGR